GGVRAGRLGNGDTQPGLAAYASTDPHARRFAGEPARHRHRRGRADAGQRGASARRRLDKRDAMILVLIAAAVLGLIMIPFGLPGTLVIFGAALTYYLVYPGTIGLATVIGSGILMLIAEGLEWSLASRYAKKYGGS